MTRVQNPRSRIVGVFRISQVPDSSMVRVFLFLFFFLCTDVFHILTSIVSVLQSNIGRRRQVERPKFGIQALDIQTKPRRANRMREGNCLEFAGAGDAISDRSICPPLDRRVARTTLDCQRGAPSLLFRRGTPYSQLSCQHS